MYYLWINVILSLICVNMNTKFSVKDKIKSEDILDKAILSFLSRDSDGKSFYVWEWVLLLLLLLSHFSRVLLCVTPETAAHQAPLSLGFSRQEHWSGLPFPSPMHESEKWKGSRSVVSHSSRPHGLQPTRLLRAWQEYWSGVPLPSPGNEC